jgi:prevent-host-death family protein
MGAAMATWAVQDAKARFSEVLDLAERKGPQIITRRGVEVAVICPIEEWKRIHRPTPAESPKRVLTNEEFLQLLRSGPDFEVPERHASRAAIGRRRH